MKLIKISTEHYVVVDETIQPVNGYYYDSFIKAIRNTSAAEYGEANHCWQITHSTQPLSVKPITDKVVIEEDKDGKPLMSAQYVELDMSSTVKQLSLQEVQELIGEVDVDKDYVLSRLCAHNKRNPDYIPYDEDDESRKPTNCYCDNCFYGRTILSEKILQLNQTLEDNKEKKYTEEDMIQAFAYGRTLEPFDSFEDFIQSLQPKTEWEVEIVDGKLKLKL